MKTRIMYLENKSEQGLNSVGRIGRVRFSKTYKTIYYKDQYLEVVQELAQSASAKPIEVEV